MTNTLIVLIRDEGEPFVKQLGEAGANPLPALSAGVLLFTIVRFYLGNVRHVDDFYVAATVDGKSLDPSVITSRRFVSDFAVLLVEALAFSLASFYIVHASNFTEIVMILLAADITWTVTAKGVIPHQGFWFLNNLVHLFAIGICFGFHLKYETSSLPFYFAIGFLLTNGLIDFIWNRAFYFADRRHEDTVFLSAPFSQFLTEDGLPQEFRKRLSEIIQHLEAKGWSVGNAHEREAWGEKLDSPYKALNADLRGIEDASVLVAILNSPPSPGVQMEIGFALAKGKKLILVGSSDGTAPYLVRGVKERESVVVVPDHDDAHELATKISEALETLD